MSAPNQDQRGAPFVHRERARFERLLADADEHELRVQALVRLRAVSGPGPCTDDDRWRLERVVEACRARGLGAWVDRELADAPGAAELAG